MAPGQGTLQEAEGHGADRGPARRLPGLDDVAGLVGNGPAEDARAGAGDRGAVEPGRIRQRTHARWISSRADADGYDASVVDADCPFCAIAAGRIPATVVAETADAIAFLDINPATRGHLLVIPRRHADDLLATEPEELAAVMTLARDLGRRAVHRLGASGVGFYSFSGSDAGQTVFHWHVHVVPRYADDPLGAPWVPGSAPQVEAAEIAALLADST